MTPRINRALAIFLVLLLNANSVFPFASSSRVSAPGVPNKTIPLPNRKPPRPLAIRRAQETARPAGETTTALPDGRLVLIGGEGPNGPLPSVTLSNPQTGEITVLPNLQHARAWHSASMLPDGRVLVLGGIGYGRNPVNAAEVLDVETRTIERLPNTRLRARAYHSATLLTDGRVLIAGGSSRSATAIAEVELFDLKTNEVTTLAARLVVPRQKHTATLLQDGSVAIQNGVDSQGNEVKTIELFDTNSGTFNATSGLVESRDTYLTASLPQSGATNVPIDTLIALRFSREVRAGWATRTSIVLNSPDGVVDSKVVPCERGKLVFVSPKTYLQPDVMYTLTIAEGAGEGSSATTITFRTSASSPIESDEGEEWIPGEKNLSGDWRSNRPESQWQKLPALEAENGVTALAGQLLLLNGNPLADVTLTIGSATARTDHTGRFLLRGLAKGHHVLLVDGRTANKANKSYGIFRIGVDINDGRTNRLPFVIWMPKLDTRNAVTIASPTNKEVIIKTPYIPNLELHIPSGSTIRGLDDQIVNQVSITPIPIDRPPYPLPGGLNVPVFFTIQPGGAKVIPPRAQVYYPNYSGSAPGSRIYFWRYDPEERGWYIYGQGTVTPNGKQVIPDPGLAIYDFGGIMTSSSAADGPPSRYPPAGSSTGTGGGDPNEGGGAGAAGAAAGSGSGSGGGAGDGHPGGPGSPHSGSGTGGDPVDLSTGLFTLTTTDLVVPDTIPIELTRTYRPGDSFARGFGIGTRFLYDMKLWSAQNYQEVDLVLPTGAPIHYVRISSGTGWWDAEFEHTATPTSFYKSRIIWNGGGWDLKFADGTVYVMGEFAPIQAIKDRFGNTLTITRANGTTGNITQITSPNSRWIKFTYDTSDRITQAQDNVGRTVNYAYDAGGRLWKVTDPNGGVTEYTYDIANQMLTLKDAKGTVYLTNEYDANGRVRKQILADETPANTTDNPTYQFTYTLDGNGKVTQADVTDPRNNINRVTFNANGYPLVHTYAAGRPEAQSLTYERQSGSNIIVSTTDHLGRKTSYTRESMGFISQITVLDGTAEALSAHFTYTPTYHLPQTVTDPMNRQISFGYDSKGALTSVTTPVSDTYSFTNSSTGQRLSATDPLNNTYQFAYDGPDLTQVTDPLSRNFSRFTDGISRTLTTKNPSGQVAKYQYDSLSRLTSIKDPLLGVSSFSYDANNNLVSLTDARNNATSFAYDNSNRAITRQDPVLRSDSLQYSADGTLQQTTDRKNQITTYSYDVIGRITGATFADSSTTTYTYDTANRLTQAVNSTSGSVTFTYDNHDRITQKSTAQGVISYAYDSAGCLTTMTVSGQPAVNYSYDGAGRLSQITQGSNQISLGYDSANRRASLTLSNGITTEYSYNGASQLTALTYKQGNNVIGNLTYTYDTNGRRAIVGGSFARTNLPPTLTSADYDDANRQISFASQSLTFDENGSLTSDGSNTYTWNARNQLASVTGPSLTATFQYDAFGNRTSKTINGVTTSYLYDGHNLVQEQSGGQVISNLVNGGLDELLLRSTSGTVSSAVADGIGSTLALTDTTGAIQTEYTYDPFGQTTTSGTATNNSSQFTGRENDGTGLYYYRARYYSPSLHRFISEDPIGLAAGPNLYAYANNSPTNLTDPFGLNPQDDPTAGMQAAISQSLAMVLLAMQAIVALAMSSGPGGPGMGAGGLGGRLPPYTGGKTAGILRTASGDIELLSGIKGPGSLMPKGSSGFDIVSRTHVEGHAAAFMQQNGLTEATLYINNPAVCSSCVQNLPRMLPPGSTLNVVTGNGTVTTFVGRVP